MRVLAFLIGAGLCLGGMTAQAQPFENLFDYKEPRRPVAGDCRQIAAAIGADATWRGEYSGKRYDDFTENYYPFGLRGCFESEQACRIWQNQAMTYGGRGPTYATSCRRGLG